MRTAENKPPLQLFILGMQRIESEDGVVPNEYFQNLTEVMHRNCRFVQIVDLYTTAITLNFDSKRLRF